MPPPYPRALRRAAVPVSLAAALGSATVLPASAHVGVSSPDAAPGGDGTLVFRVPTESGTASTTRLQVRLPRTRPFASVAVQPVPGWTVSTREQKLPHPVTDDGFTLTRAVSAVTWTARRGHGLPPGQFQEFTLSVGPFPDGVRSIGLPAVQTYSDGSVVHWDQPTPAGGKEPEHPAPTLDLAQPTAAATPARPDSTARWLGGAGLVLGLVALAVAVLGRRRSS